MINGETQVSIAFVFAIVAVIGTLYGIASSAKKNNKDEAAGIIKANLKLDELCQTTRETRLDIRTLETKIDQVKEKQMEHELRLQNVEKKVEEM